MKDRVAQGFATEYGREPEVVTRAPGRLEILGNHTDYNEGVVLSVAVDRNTWVAAAPAPGRDCRLKDLRDGSSRTFSLDRLDGPEPGDWANYVKGIVVELRKRGIEIDAFDAVLCSTVPMSAGMSSSAALEMSMCKAIGRLRELDLAWTEWARIGQGSENNYVGARTGLLDQFSSLMGKAGQLVFSDFRSLEVSNVPLPGGTSLVVANCMVKHELTNEYNERRSRCEEALAFLQQRSPGISATAGRRYTQSDRTSDSAGPHPLSSESHIGALRDVSREQLEACRGEMDILPWRRAMHVVGENERVFAGIRALQDDDLATFGRLMVESQESSRLNFENSCTELDILVELGSSLPGFIGARLSGGGFGGITVHLVEAAEAETYSHRLATAYESRTDIKPEVMICRAGDGAEVVAG